MNEELKSLKVAHPDLTFRFFEKPQLKHNGSEPAMLPFMRYQAGTERVEELVLPPDETTGFLGFEGPVTRFHLIACAATADKLSEILSQNNNQNKKQE